MSSANERQVGEMLVACTPTLRAFVRRRVGDRDTTNEILQEVSLRALAGRGPRDSASFVAWTLGIARYVIGIEWRRRSRVRLEESLADPMGTPCRDLVGPADRRFDARELLMQALGADTRGVALLVRRYLGRASGKELAAEMGLTPAALRMRVLRVRSAARARGASA
jgi:DNA-directed RNA polymerase specialized sigma24 family protein